MSRRPPQTEKPPSPQIQVPVSYHKLPSLSRVTALGLGANVDDGCERRNRKIAQPALQPGVE